MRRYIRNIRGALATICRHTPGKYFAVMVYELVSENIRQFLGILVPSLIVDCITFGGSARRVIVLAGVYAGIVVLTDMLHKSISLFSTAYWYRAANLATFDICEKGMQLDCAELDSSAVLDEYHRAIQSPWEFLCVDELVIKKLTGAVLTILEMLWILGQVHFAVMVSVFALSFLSTVIKWKKTKKQHKEEKTIQDLVRRTEYPLQLLQDYQVGKELRLYHMLPFFTDLYREQDQQKIHAVYQADQYAARMETWCNLMDMIRFVLVYGAAIYRYAAGMLTIGAFTMYYGALQALTDALESLFQVISDILDCSLYYEDYERFLERKGNGNSGTKAAQNGDITFENVCFSYSPSARDILHDLNFTIHKGEHIAIVGENGAGKSTLVKLITRLYEASSGEITVGQEDIKVLSQDTYWSLFAPVFQDFALYSIPVRDNIAFMQADDTDGIWRALANSGADHLVRELSRGLDTSVSKLLDDEGVDFSGGEAQRLALARAYYKNAPVLILDEPTAALDPLAEEEIYRYIQKMSGDKTVIYISHRISSTRHADRIFVVGENRILESGTFSQLMEKQGVYYDMFQKQAAPYFK